MTENNTNYALSAEELCELLHELDNCKWALESIEEFVEKLDAWDIPYSDILWFLDWSHGGLFYLNQWVLHPYGSWSHFYDTWDEYLEDTDLNACYESDPLCPEYGEVFVDAGLSGVYYLAW